MASLHFEARRQDLERLHVLALSFQLHLEELLARIEIRADEAVVGVHHQLRARARMRRLRRRALHHLVGGHDVHDVHVVEHHLRGILVHGLHRVAPRHVHGGGALRLARRVVAGGQRGHQLVDALAQLPHESPSIRAEGCSAGSDGCPSRSSASPRAGCASIGECFT